MKNFFLLFMAMMAFAFGISAQNIPENALGLRLGDSDGFGAEVSYQRALGENNRLELDLGWKDGKNYNGFKLAALYQWVFVLDGAFNWYVGAGGGLGSFSIDNPGGNDITDTFFFAAGDIGIEYAFEFPLQLSLDFRPEIGFGDELYDNNDLDFDIALGIRYQF